MDLEETEAGNDSMTVLAKAISNLTDYRHIEMIEAKAFRTLIRIYSLLKIERLSANIRQTLHKALITSVMTYACTAQDFATDT
jgi:hypothetical protein